jgi:NAD+ kinase
MRKVGICYHPKLPDEVGRRLAEELHALAARHVDDTWTASAWDEEASRAQIPGTDLLVCVGGDGTVLRAARLACESETLLLGVNMGRLGFLTELDPEGALARLPDVIGGAGRVERRAMLHAEVAGDGGRPTTHDALNDVVLGRVSLGRTVEVSVRIDGALLANYKADGVIVATATGSTAYSLSAGGPVLAPEAREILLTPLAPHLAFRNSVVLPPDAAVEVRLDSGQRATFSMDGERELDLAPGETVRMALGPHDARFVRLGPEHEFYERLARQLNWLREGQHEDIDALRSVLGEEATA